MDDSSLDLVRGMRRQDSSLTMRAMLREESRQQGTPSRSHLSPPRKQASDVASRPHWRGERARPWRDPSLSIVDRPAPPPRPPRPPSSDVKGKDFPVGLQGQLAHAVRMLGELGASEAAARDAQLEAMRAARGLVFMTQIKAGFLVSGTIAAGLIICRTPDGGWSAPSALGATGIGMGLQMGAQTTDIIISLRTPEAVRDLISSGGIRFGGDAHYTLPDVVPGPSHGGVSHRGVGSERGVTAYSRSGSANLTLPNPNPDPNPNPNPNPNLDPNPDPGRTASLAACRWTACR